MLGKWLVIIHTACNKIWSGTGYLWIVIWWWFGTFFIFPFSWECHNPNWRTHIFQRGRYTTNQPVIVALAILVGGFNHFLFSIIYIHIWDNPIDFHIFQDGLVHHQPEFLFYAFLRCRWDTTRRRKDSDTSVTETRSQVRQLSEASWSDGHQSISLI